jgi:hypothetical protein
MSKLMLIFGILFMSLGVALGFLIHFKPGQMQVVALTPEVSAILLVGGALCLGLGGLIGALRDRAVATTAPVEVVAEAAAEKPATPKFTGFGKKAATATVATEPAAAAIEEVAAESTASPKTSVAETVSALEQAKSDIAAALGVEARETPAAEPVTAKAEPEAVETVELYVVEEKVIRGRPARVLSDGTVEAETDEGWMRFENLEHLDEYLEAMVPEV